MCTVTIIIIHLYLHPAAPSGSVSQLLGSPVNSQTILLSWLPPPLLQHNGIIRYFTVYNTETDTGVVNNYTSSFSNITLVDLHPYYTYRLVVHAVTVREGPPSDPVMVQTLEAGNINLSLSIYVHALMLGTLSFFLLYSSKQ